MVVVLPFEARHRKAVRELLLGCGVEIEPFLFDRHFFEMPPLNCSESDEPLHGILLVDGERVVGFLGLVPREVYRQKTCLSAYEMGALGIESAYRLYAPLLTRQLDRQKTRFACYSNTVNVLASRMFRAAGFMEGCMTCARICYRVCDWRGLIRSAVAKHPRGRYMPEWLANTLGIILNKAHPILYPLPREQKGSVSRRMTDINPTVFHDFWKRYLDSNHGLVSSRQPEVLEWLFGEELRKGEAVLLTRFIQDCLVGYLILRRRPLPAAGCFRFTVADWIAIDNNLEILGNLLRDACVQARANGAAVIELIGFPEKVRQLIARYLPLYRTADSNTFIFKVADQMTGETFLREAEEGWFWGPCDGDRCVMS